MLRHNNKKKEEEEISNTEGINSTKTILQILKDDNSIKSRKTEYNNAILRQEAENPELPLKDFIKCSDFSDNNNPIVDAEEKFEVEDLNSSEEEEITLSKKITLKK